MLRIWNAVKTKSKSDGPMLFCGTFHIWDHRTSHDNGDNGDNGDSSGFSDADYAGSWPTQWANRLHCRLWHLLFGACWSSGETAHSSAPSRFICSLAAEINSWVLTCFLCAWAHATCWTWQTNTTAIKCPRFHFQYFLGAEIWYLLSSSWLYFSGQRAQFLRKPLPLQHCLQDFHYGAHVMFCIA